METLTWIKTDAMFEVARGVTRNGRASRSLYSGPSCSRLFRTVVDSAAKAGQQLSKLLRPLPASFHSTPFQHPRYPMLWLLMYSVYTQPSADKDCDKKKGWHSQDYNAPCLPSYLRGARSSISARVRSLEWFILGKTSVKRTAQVLLPIFIDVIWGVS